MTTTTMSGTDQAAEAGTILEKHSPVDASALARPLMQALSAIHDLQDLAWAHYELNEFGTNEERPAAADFVAEVQRAIAMCAAIVEGCGAGELPGGQLRRILERVVELDRVDSAAADAVLDGAS
jgi:hypothetical protein